MHDASQRIVHEHSPRNRVAVTRANAVDFLEHVTDDPFAVGCRSGDPDDGESETVHEWHHDVL